MKKIIRRAEKILRRRPVVPPPVNIVSSFFFYMWNAWGSQEECRKVFEWNSDHFWSKWVALFREDSHGAAEKFYAELSPDNRRRLVERACEVYNGSHRKKLLP